MELVKAKAGLVPVKKRTVTGATITFYVKPEKAKEMMASGKAEKGMPKGKKTKYEREMDAYTNKVAHTDYEKQIAESLEKQRKALGMGSRWNFDKKEEPVKEESKPVSNPDAYLDKKDIKQINKYTDAILAEHNNPKDLRARSQKAVLGSIMAGKLGKNGIQELANHIFGKMSKTNNIQELIDKGDLKGAMRSIASPHDASSMTKFTNKLKELLAQ